MEIKMSKDEIIVKEAIEIKDNSEARVAYDLMVLIADKEFSTVAERSKQQQNRLYWLRLYDQCRRMVTSDNRYTAEGAIKASEADKDAD